MTIKKYTQSTNTDADFTLSVA